MSPIEFMYAKKVCLWFKTLSLIIVYLISQLFSTNEFFFCFLLLKNHMVFDFYSIFMTELK